MGCVFGREATSSSEPKVAKSSKTAETVQVSKSNGGAIVEVEKKKKHEEEDNSGKPKGGDRRKSKPNPRLSNPSKHWRGEQVAAGWPSWLSDACGEALNGWIPRKADTFEKIDKVLFRITQKPFFVCFSASKVSSWIWIPSPLLDWTRNVQ